MNSAASHSPAQPFFLDAAPGKRFCFYYAAAEHPARGAILYIPPFAEELNKSRRMAALQARAFSAQGYAVLQMDLFGCGDSDGEFGQARWDIWRDDLGRARAWLNGKVSAPFSMWALRLGAVLALDFARHAQFEVERLLLWQPVLQADQYLTQFLRLRLAADMLGSKDQPPATVKQLRALLASGTPLEVAGYELAPELVAALENADASGKNVLAKEIHCFDVMTDAAEAMSPMRESHMAALALSGRQPIYHALQGQAFWSAQEPQDCPQLIAATLDAMQT